MSIFVILSDGPNPPLQSRIKELYPDDFFEINGQGQWAISANGVTTNSIKDQLEVTAGKYGRVIIFKTSGSAGWHNKSLWEWLRLKGED